ncbi:ATP-dependent zinc protease [Thioalkalivibrio sulfidiphilus]|uniref:ATP-dependent zinc protease family protein n=1 Tax=Thioalkalivibrio sulfidiphilus TaxID=1033854 RepID=UPI003B31E654
MTRLTLHSVTLAVGLTAAAAFLPAPANADEPQPDILGFVEWIVIQDTGLRMKARLDTGALTSSMHAINVEAFDRDGEEWVRFDVPLNDHHDVEGVVSGSDIDPDQVAVTFERPVERKVDIRRKGADPQTRYVVKMEFCIDGRIQEEQFSLTDRHNFMYPALLGRRYMAEDNVAVDSSGSFLARERCEYEGLKDLVAEHAAP